MQHYPVYQPQSPEMVQLFLEQRPCCILITQSVPGPPTAGFFNPLVESTRVYLHLHRQDPQLKQLQQNPEATLVFTDYHGYVPSYAKDPEDASFATMFYRFAEVRAKAQLIEDPDETEAVLDRMMARYQPEGGYRPMSGNRAFYGPSLRLIQLVSLTIQTTQSKWKLGQNRTAEERLRAHSFIHT